jgi:hypothetical protein
MFQQNWWCTNQYGPLKKRKKKVWAHPWSNLIWITIISRVFFARGISLGQRCWWTLLGRKISCSQHEGPSVHSRCLAFFFFPQLGGGGFFSFFPSSQCVSTMCPSSSQWVPIGFSICSPSSQCVPQHVLHSTSLLSYMFWQMLSSFHLYRWAKGDELYTSK